MCVLFHVVKLKAKLVPVPGGFSDTRAGSVFPLLLSQNSKSPQLCLPTECDITPGLFYLLLHVPVWVDALPHNPGECDTKLKS